MEYINNIDMRFLIFLHELTKNNIFDYLMPIITNLGYGGFIWIIFSLFMLTRKKYRKVGILCLLALFLTTIVGELILKNIFQRPRPFTVMPNVQLLIAKPSSYSFPSGHAASSFAAAGILSNQIKKWSIPVFILAALIAFSRIYLYVHYPLDVIGGILLGLLCAKVTLLVCNRRKNI